MSTTNKPDKTIIPRDVDVPCLSETYPSGGMCPSYSHRYFAVRDAITEKVSMMPTCSHHYSVMVAKHGGPVTTKAPKEISSGFQKFMSLPLWKQQQLLGLLEEDDT